MGSTGTEDFSGRHLALGGDFGSPRVASDISAGALLGLVASVEGTTVHHTHVQPTLQESSIYAQVIP